MTRTSYNFYIKTLATVYILTNGQKSFFLLLTKLNVKSGKTFIEATPTVNSTESPNDAKKSLMICCCWLFRILFPIRKFSWLVWLQISSPSLAKTLGCNVSYSKSHIHKCMDYKRAHKAIGLKNLQVKQGTSSLRHLGIFHEEVWE